MTVLCGIVVLGVGCGQPAPPGEGEGASESGSETGDADPELLSLYPLVEGAEWTYRAEDAFRSVTGTEVVHIKKQEWLGKPAFLLFDEDDASGEHTESVIVRDGSAAYRVHKEVFKNGISTMLVDYAPGFVRADDGWSETGQVQEYTYNRTETDGGGGNEVADERTHKFTVVDPDVEIALNPGTFRAVHMRRERTTGALSGEVVEYWYAPGVGKLQEHRLANQSLGLEESWEVLIAFTMPGSVDGA